MERCKHGSIQRRIEVPCPGCGAKELVEIAHEIEPIVCLSCGIDDQDSPLFYQGGLHHVHSDPRQVAAYIGCAPDGMKRVHVSWIGKDHVGASRTHLVPDNVPDWRAVRLALDVLDIPDDARNLEIRCT